MMKQTNPCSLDRVLAFTDGSCIGNPGPGGWAAIMMRNEKRRVLEGGDLATTNQRMEVTAVIRAVASMKTDAPLTIISDSNYVVMGMTKWITSWKSTGWKNSSRKDVANRDLWEELDGLVRRRLHGVEFKWTKGHAGQRHNEEADRRALAQARIFEARLVS